MDAYDAVTKMLNEDDRTRAAISVAMGRGPGYLNVIVGRRSVPKADTLARIADTCGYDLLLRRRDSEEEIRIEPTK